MVKYCSPTASQWAQCARFLQRTGMSQQAYYYRLRKLCQQCTELILQEFQLEAPTNTKQNIQIHYHGAVIEIENDTVLETVLLIREILGVFVALFFVQRLA